MKKLKNESMKDLVGGDNWFQCVGNMMVLDQTSFAVAAIWCSYAFVNPITN